MLFKLDYGLIQSLHCWVFEISSIINPKIQTNKQKIWKVNNWINNLRILPIFHCWCSEDHNVPWSRSITPLRKEELYETQECIFNFDVTRLFRLLCSNTEMFSLFVSALSPSKSTFMPFLPQLFDSCLLLMPRVTCEALRKDSWIISDFAVWLPCLCSAVHLFPHQTCLISS